MNKFILIISSNQTYPTSGSTNPTRVTLGRMVTSPPPLSFAPQGSQPMMGIQPPNMGMFNQPYTTRFALTKEGKFALAFDDTDVAVDTLEGLIATFIAGQPEGTEVQVLQGMTSIILGTPVHVEFLPAPPQGVTFALVDGVWTVFNRITGKQEPFLFYFALAGQFESSTTSSGLTSLTVVDCGFRQIKLTLNAFGEVVEATRVAPDRDLVTVTDFELPENNNVLEFIYFGKDHPTGVVKKAREGNTPPHGVNRTWGSCW